MVNNCSFFIYRERAHVLCGMVSKRGHGQQDVSCVALNKDCDQHLIQIKEQSKTDK